MIGERAVVIVRAGALTIDPPPGACGSVAPDASCTVVVTFAPSVAGTTYHGQLTLIVPYFIADQATLVGTGG